MPSKPVHCGRNQPDLLYRIRLDSVASCVWYERHVHGERLPCEQGRTLGLLPRWRLFHDLDLRSHHLLAGVDEHGQRDVDQGGKCR